MLFLIKCPRCGCRLQDMPEDSHIRCSCGHDVRLTDGIIHYSDEQRLNAIPEVAVRDRQAAGYLQHSKFPTQIDHVRSFLDALPASSRDKPVLELGCGPGPYTGLLLEAGWEVVAVDFSQKSLAANRASAVGYDRRALFVKADVTELECTPECSNLLMMCDFLQHLDGFTARTKFIKKAFDWLTPGGYFYLSFFNFNIVNFIKGDLHGSFSNGTIRYERLISREVVESFPSDIEVLGITPLNIFHQPGPDRLVARLPGARFLARMIAVSGRRRIAAAKI